MAPSTVPIRTGEDVVRVRQEVRRFAIEAGLGLVDQTKVVTAASELARNTLDYGKGGRAVMDSYKMARGAASGSCSRTTDQASRTSIWR